MSSTSTSEINGNPAALSFDRAVDELRRGRAVHVTDGERGLVVAAIETVQAPLFERLVSASSARAVMLVYVDRAGDSFDVCRSPERVTTPTSARPGPTRG